MTWLKSPPCSPSSVRCLRIGLAGKANENEQQAITRIKKRSETPTHNTDMYTLAIIGANKRGLYRGGNIPHISRETQTDWQFLQGITLLSFSLLAFL